MPLESSNSESRLVGAGVTVAVVDDDPDVLETVVESLESMGCGVVSFSDSQRAAEYLLNQHVDGVIVDAVMPSIDGAHLIKLVRTSGANDKSVIGMISGYTEPSLMQDSFAAGASLFLAKPVTLEKLRRFVNLTRAVVVKETRRSKRVPFTARVTCVAAQRSCEARCVNLSEGGVLVQGLSGVSVGELLDLEFELPGSRQTTRLSGKVVRCQTDLSIAISFLAVPSVHRRAIARYITELAK